MEKKKHMTRDELLIRKGKIQGTKENMDMVAMVLLDKFGFHIQEETADERDTKSLSYLYNCIVELVREVNEGRIRRRHIADMLSEEYGVKNVGGEKE